MRHRVFLLSPASATGKRARLLLKGPDGPPLARALDAGRRVTLAEAFTFTSGLYFRGKRAYAERFARPPDGRPGAFVITATRGLLPLETPMDAAALREFAAGSIDPADPGYADPLRADAERLAAHLDADGQAVLLGSIATDKYIGPLAEAFGERLVFPEAFVGRGDMSRGGLLLRCARAGTELRYVSALEADRRGSRPPRLDQDDASP